MAGESRNLDESSPMDPRQSFDVIFDLLSHHRRRCILACLLEYQETIALGDLAEEVALRENGTPIMELSAHDLQAVETSLYHTHVPKLADAGVVDYEPDRSLVRLAGNTERIERFITLTPSGGGEW